MASSPKRHHYLPEVYLKGFCRDGGLWVHDFTKVNTFGTQPLNVTVESYYYSIVRKDGVRDNAIESFLARVESSVRETLEGLREQQLPGEHARAQLALFITLMIGRVPAFEAQLQGFFGQMLERLARANAVPEGAFDHVRTILAGQRGCTVHEISDAELLAWVRENGAPAAVHRNEILGHLLRVASMAQGPFLRMRWEFWFAPEKSSFATIDRPLVLLPTEKRPPSMFGMGLFDASAIRVIPLTQNCCLILRVAATGMGESVVEHASAQSVRVLNLELVYRTHRFAMARDEALIRNLVERVTPARKLKKAAKIP